MGDLLTDVFIALLAIGVACAIACCAQYPTPKGGCIDTRDGGNVRVFFQRIDAGD